MLLHPDDKAQLNRIERMLRHLLKKEELLAMSLQDDFTALKAAVAAEKTVDDSAITLMQGLKAQLDALASQPTISSADVQALSSQLATEQGALAAAVSANTPAAPPPPPPAAATGAPGGATQ